MARYSASGAGGAASSTAATAGIIKVENAATLLSVPRIYEFGVYPAAAAEDSNYAINVKRQSTAGTWTTSITPSPMDTANAAAKAVTKALSTAAGTAAAILGTFGFNQRGGFRWVAVPNGEFWVDRANSAGIIIEYAFVVGSAVNNGTIFFEE